ncbi:MAG: hypothetical protein QXG78_04680, partial [Candidatus Methanomethyliaceae archaeon]
FIVGSLMLSHEIRRDSKVNIIIDKEICITFNGKVMRNVRPDESSLSGIIKAGLRKIGKKVLPGVIVKRINLEDFFNKVKVNKLYYSEKIGKIQDISNEFFIVFQYPKLEIEELLLRMNFLPIKLSKKSLFPDQAVVILNNKLDRKIFGI